MKRIIKTVLILLILGGIGFMMFNIFDNNKYKNDSIDKCTYSHGGGMLGDVYSVSARKLKDGSSELVIQQAPSHNERIVTKIYKIDNNIFEEIKKIMLDYNLYKASKKGKSPFEVLDAPSTSLYLSFEKNDSFSVNDYQNLSNKDFEGINNILDKMLSYASGDPIISIEPHELALSIDGYNIFYYMNESKASEQLVELADKYLFSSFNDNGKKFHLEEKLDISDCPLADGNRIGVLAYYEPSNDIIFFYKQFEAMEGLYELGLLDYDSESSFNLISKMLDEEYYLNKFK